jgi:hypothetical protein
MSWLQTIHPVTVIVTALGFLLGASLMLAAIDLKFVSQAAVGELAARDIRQRRLGALRGKDGCLIRRTFLRRSLCHRTRSDLTPSVPLAIARLLASAVGS